MNDKSLEKLFSSYNPTLSSNGDFMDKLQAKLEAVEMVKQYQQAEARRYRVAVIATFAIGFCMGAAVTALIFSLPADIHLYNYGLQSAVFMFIEHNYRLLSLFPALGLVCFLSYNIFQILNETLAMTKLKAAI